MPPSSPIWDLFWTDKTKYGNNKNNNKAWCKACLDGVVAQEKEAEVVRAASSALQVPSRSLEEWYNLVKDKCSHMCGKPEDNMRRHLNKYPVIANSLERQKRRTEVLALADAAKKGGASAAQSTSSSRSDMPPPSPFQSGSQFSPTPPPLSPLIPFAQLETLPPGSPFSPSASPTPSLLFDRGDKRRRSSTTGYLPPWTDEQQEEFNEDLCKLFVTCGWAWNAANNPEFKIFFGKYLPHITIPDCRVLSGRVLDREAAKVIARSREETNGKLATYSQDGWTNIARTHVDTSVISVEGTSFLLRTHDMTGRPKTGDELHGIVKSDIEYAKDTYGVETIAICTDDGPDGKKMRRLVKEQTPWIAAFECWGHQAHLITGNYLSIKAPWMAVAKQAVEIVKFFLHHQIPLDLLCAQELLTIGHFLALLLPVLTRWLSQYCCVRRLLRLQKEIQVVMITHEVTLRLCLGRKAEQIAVAESAIELCKDMQFWKSLERIANHLEPLAIASNILQAPYCRLDLVLLTLGNLYRFFGDLPESDREVTETIQASLERRWAKTDQELMILAVFFNPFVRTGPFNPDSIPPITFFHLVRRAFKRLLRQDPDGDSEFMSAFNSYYDNAGFFSNENMWIEGHRRNYEENNQHVDLVSIWRRMDNTRGLRGRAGFVSLAVRILSILPNSAGPERVFSEFGIQHTKHRNRMNPLVVHKSTIVRTDRRKQHVAAGLVPKRKLRRCSVAEDQAAMAAMEEEDDEPTLARVGEDGILSMENDFEAMANVLINIASRESDGNDEDEAAAPSQSASAPTATPSASSIVTDAYARIPAYTKIPLEKLFVYPPRGTPSADLEFFWRVGRAGVDAEEQDMDTVQNSATAAAAPVATEMASS